MATSSPMQLGMIGLGRMGANLTRRLMNDGHHVVVYDVNADAVKSLAADGATGTNTLADFVDALEKRRKLLLPRRHHQVQGPRAAEAALPRRRHLRRRLGP